MLARRRLGSVRSSGLRRVQVRTCRSPSTSAARLKDPPTTTLVPVVVAVLAVLAVAVAMAVAVAVVAARRRGGETRQPPEGEARLSRR